MARDLKEFGSAFNDHLPSTEGPNKDPTKAGIITC